MAEGFLRRYGEELNALRRRAARFAEAHPKIAGRLRISGETGDDPHVERIVQSFAFVAARIRQKLDDEFPELTGSLLETLYPHYLAPIPSMAMVKLTPAEGLDEVQIVRRGAELTAEPLDNERCRFRTTQDVAVAPIELTDARLMGQPIEAPATAGKAAGCLRLSLRGLNRNQPIHALHLKRLRLHIQGPWREAAALHELILNHATGIALARHPHDPNAAFLSPSHILPVGFADDEAALPAPATAFAGYRLLSEFFAFPQKFLFLDITGLERWSGEQLEIFIYLDRTVPALERHVSRRSFALHATPVINLFAQRAEPIVVDGTRTEYSLIPDARRHKTREIYSVEGVTLSDRQGRQSRAEPFFGRLRDPGGEAIYWQLHRSFQSGDGSSDASIAFVDRSHQEASRPDLVASVDTLCLNRDLPEALPYGGGHPRLELQSHSDAVQHVEAVTPPTQVLRLQDDEGRHWRLLSHLNLNHLSLGDGNGSALREILRLYALRDLPETQQMIDAICGVSMKPSAARLRGGSMVPGTEIELEFDPKQIDRASAHMFSTVLDRFLALYASINSYTRLTSRLKGQSEPVLEGLPRIGDRPLL